MQIPKTILDRLEFKNSTWEHHDNRPIARIRYDAYACPDCNQMLYEQRVVLHRLDAQRSNCLNCKKVIPHKNNK